MNSSKFVLTPYYEILDYLLPPQRLTVVEGASLDTKGRFICSQMVEFDVSYSKSFLMCESKRQKSSNFNIRGIIRFCKIDDVRRTEHNILVNDTFPLHLHLDMNNKIITLPNLLPNDRCGKDGRRFPRPVDITEAMIDNPFAINRLVINWVQEESKNDNYCFAMFLVRLRSSEELTKTLVSQNISVVATTLKLIYDQCLNLNGAVDDDLMLVNSFIGTSLNCPVSRSRMTVPIRGKDCNHLQCFDAMTYLVMNFNKPTWLCPVCDKPSFYCYLEVDGLFYNILQDERSKSAENIQFNKSGQWRPEQKIPGRIKDDSPFYSIAEYLVQSQSNATNEQPSPISKENTITCKKEKSLSENIPDSAKINGALPQHINPSNITSSDRTSTNTGSNTQPQMTMHYHMDGNHAFNSHNGNPNYTATQPNTFSSYVAEKNLDQKIMISQQPSNPLPPQYYGSYIPQVTDNGMAPTLRITNVKSMARQNKEQIIISDDDVEEIMKSAIDNTKVAQKRPTMVSSVPSVPTKQMKFFDSPNAQMARPHSASVNDSSPRLQANTHVCNCTPGRFCSYHRELLSSNDKTFAGYNRYSPMDIPPQYTVPNIPSSPQTMPQSYNAVTNGVNKSILQTSLMENINRKNTESSARDNIHVNTSNQPSNVPFMNYPNQSPQSYPSQTIQKSPYVSKSCTVPPSYPPALPHHQQNMPHSIIGSNIGPSSSATMPTGQPMMQYPYPAYVSAMPTGQYDPRFGQNLQTLRQPSVQHITCRNTSTEISVTHEPSLQPAVQNGQYHNYSSHHGPMTQPLMPPQYSSPVYNSHLSSILNGTNSVFNQSPAQHNNRRNSVTQQVVTQTPNGDVRHRLSDSNIANGSSLPRSIANPDLNQSFANSLMLNNVPRQKNPHPEMIYGQPSYNHKMLSHGNIYQPPSQMAPIQSQNGPFEDTNSRHPMTQEQWCQMMNSYQVPYPSPEAVYGNAPLDYLMPAMVPPMNSFNSYSNFSNVYNG